MPDDYANNFDTQTEIIVDTPIKGVINDPKDQDVFRIFLNKGEKIRIDMYWDDHGSVMPEVLYAIAYPDNNRHSILVPKITKEQDYRGSSYFYYTANTEGVHFIQIAAGRDANEIRADEGEGYTLLASLQDKYLNSEDTQGHIALGSSVTSAIDAPGDRDWLHLPLVAGFTYQIDVEGSGGDPLLSPNLDVVNWEGDDIDFLERILIQQRSMAEMLMEIVGLLLHLGTIMLLC